MKVIYTKDFQGKAKKGQLAEVAEGFARNYLIPHGIAVQATPDAINAMKISDEAQARRNRIEKQEALDRKKELENKIVVIKAKAGSAGKLFGSITSKEISIELKNQFDVDIPKNKLVLNEAIKTFGTFHVKIRLYPEVVADLKVSVKEE